MKKTNRIRSRATRMLGVAAAAALATACSVETHEEISTQPGGSTQPAAADTAEAPEAPAAETAPAATEGPAGEVAAETREPAAAAPAEPATTETAVADSGDGLDWDNPQMPEGLDAKWKPYWAKIPFVFGSKAGLALAEKTGKPMMMFYSATW